MKRFSIILFSALLLSACCGQYREISESTLRDKIAGAWLGQMVGNIYGLDYENDFVDEPGPDGPYEFEKAFRKMSQVDGAFSDDDTDVEYLYLLMMEKYGVSPTYAQIREGWMYHIRDRVWLANRATLGLMHYGLTPPFTGDLRYNPHWFQIDPQLINEIWGYTAPGMPAYSAGISDWAARITSDSWAVSPTVAYGVMYSEAFFESNIKRLIRKGQKALPEGDRFRTIIDECFEQYKAHPKDWRAARQALAQKYWFDEPDTTKTIWNADLNGAMGILGLLYGDGDMERTMNLCCALGFDCDNQSATMCGILGVINGLASVPANLSMPYEHWTKPFNDRYINITRYDMPDASIEDIIDRTLALAEQNILRLGGSVREKNGEKYYRINRNAEFKAPLEFCVGPEPRLVCGECAGYDFACATNSGCTWKIVAGSLPEGVELSGSRLCGTPVKAGDYEITLALSNGTETIEKTFPLVVRGRNIAPEHSKIVCSVRKPNMDVIDSCWTTIPHSYYSQSIETICDGVLSGIGQSFYSLAAKTKAPKQDYFGYLFDKPRKVDMVSFHYGTLEEFGGWYSDLRVEYLDAKGNWKPVKGVRISPALPESDVVFIQPHNAEFLLRFHAVTSRGFRVIGHDKVQDHWNKYTKHVSTFISVTEVQVYEAK